MLREWVVEGGGLYGYFGEQGLPAGIQECLDFERPKLADLHISDTIGENISGFLRFNMEMC